MSLAADAQAPLPALIPGASIHMVGVAGAGMNALAAVLLARGYQLSGSDIQRSAQVERLVAKGLRFREGHDPADIAGAALLIISAAVREENPEIVAARAAGIPVVKRAAALGWLLEGLRTIAVAGTHGKTTTTAMLAVILSHAGLDPTFVVGGEVLDLGVSARWGSGDWAVVEADEYDRSFLQLRPHIAVITNVEPDHLEYYGSVEAMHQAYRQFVALVQPGGTVVLNMDDPFLSALQVPAGLRVVRCGGDAAGWRIGVPRYGGGGMRFTLDQHVPAGDRIELDLLLAGTHNAYNAMQAMAAAQAAGVDPAVSGEALRSFRGTGRRFQRLGDAGGVLVIDDYAHHPTEVRATLSAARSLYAADPNTAGAVGADSLGGAMHAARRIIAIFQPHTYSRTKLLFDQFVTAFEDADLLVLTDIYAARERDTLGVDAAHLRDAIAAQPGNPPVQLVGELAAVPGALLPQLRRGDVVLTLGAGTITELGPRLLAALRDREAALVAQAGETVTVRGDDPPFHLRTRQLDLRGD